MSTSSSHSSSSCSPFFREKYSPPLESPLHLQRGRSAFPFARAHSDITYGSRTNNTDLVYGGGSPRKPLQKKRSRARTLFRSALLLLMIITIGLGLRTWFCDHESCVQLPASVADAYSSAYSSSGDWVPKAPWRDAVEGQWVGGGAAIKKPGESLLVLGEGYMLDQDGGVVTDEGVEGGKADVLLLEGVEDEGVVDAPVGEQGQGGKTFTGEVVMEGGAVQGGDGEGEGSQKAVEGVENAKEEAKGMLGSMEMAF